MKSGSRDRSPGRLTGADLALGVVAAAAALALYVATLLPDVGGYEDNPKFQFLGAVLGVGHAPGYPLYTMVSWAFSHVPWGSLAYRANLLSAVAGASAVGFTFWAARLMHLPPVMALAVSLGLATGRWFWWYSIVAEVYSFAAMLFAGTLVAALAWSPSRGLALFYASVLLAGLTTAHHPLAVGLVPAIAAYALASAGGRMLRPRVVATSAGLFLSGYLPYLYILVRSRRAPYVEDGATSLAELIDVIRVRRFSGNLTPFGLAELLTDQVALIARLVTTELGVIGVGLFVAGLVAGWRRSRRDVLLVCVAAGVTAALVLNVFGETRGMLTPIMPALWLTAGVGGLALSARMPRAAARHLVVAALAVGLPAHNAWRNHRDNDLRGHQPKADWLRSFVGGLGPKVAFVDENYPVAMTLEYFDLLEDPIPRRRFGRVRADADHAGRARREGISVFAFDGGSALLEAEGLRSDPVVLRQTLASFLGRLEEGAVVVALARNAPLPAELSALGLGRKAPVGAAGRAAAITAIVAAARGPGRRDARGDAPFRFEVAPDGLAPDVAGAPGAHVLLRADESAAAVDVDGTPILEARDGVLLVVIGSTGQVQYSEAFPASAPVRPVFDARDVRVHRLAGEAFDRPCVTVEPGVSTDALPAGHAGGIIGRVDVGRRLVWSIRLQGVTAFAPTLEVVHGPARASLDIVKPATGPGVTDLRVAIDSRNTRNPLEPTTSSAIRLWFGAVPRRVDVTAAPADGRPARARLCAAPLPDLVDDGSGSRILPLGSAGLPYFGTGWHQPERIGKGSVRWTNQEQSVVLLPLEGGRDYRLVMDVRHALGDDAVSLAVNGRGLGSQPVSRGWTRRSWTIPAVIVQDGTNELAFLSTRTGVPRDLGEGDDGRRLGWAVRRLTIETD